MVSILRRISKDDSAKSFFDIIKIAGGFTLKQIPEYIDLLSIQKRKNM